MKKNKITTKWMELPIPKIEQKMTSVLFNKIILEQIQSGKNVRKNQKIVKPKLRSIYDEWNNSW